MLSEQQGLLLRALQPLEEGEGKEKVSHQAGDHWLIRGPLEYVPPAKVEVVEERQASHWMRTRASTCRMSRPEG